MAKKNKEVLVPRLDELAGLTDKDVELCPNCGSEGRWAVENGKRFTWQPVSFTLDPKHGLIESDYDSFDYGDDVEIESWSCSACEDEWPTLDALERAVVAAKHARADADRLEIEIGTKQQNALALMVTNPGVRLY